VMTGLFVFDFVVPVPSVPAMNSSAYILLAMLIAVICSTMLRRQHTAK
jgi:hypothetical protein